MTPKQVEALSRLCDGYKVPFDEKHYGPQFDLPRGYVAGWIGGVRHTIYVGCDPDGLISS